jgi:hypothetical protein
MDKIDELVKRLRDESRVPTQKDWDRHEAADALLALHRHAEAMANNMEHNGIFTSPLLRYRAEFPRKT